ncbi:MAG: hypothetical protein AAF547_25080, partial [Actinomycetota bacterium]
MLLLPLYKGKGVRTLAVGCRQCLNALVLVKWQEQYAVQFPRILVLCKDIKQLHHIHQQIKR